ncbi:unnamed protein product, partial [marine sediment metagenome]
NIVGGEASKFETPIDQSLFRKYIAYARENVERKLTDEVREAIKRFYKQMRTASIESGEAAAISISMRQLES